MWAYNDDEVRWLGVKHGTPERKGANDNDRSKDRPGTRPAKIDDPTRPAVPAPTIPQRNA